MEIERRRAPGCAVVVRLVDAGDGAHRIGPVRRLCRSLPSLCVALGLAACAGSSNERATGSAQATSSACADSAAVLAVLTERMSSWAPGVEEIRLGAFRWYPGRRSTPTASASAEWPPAGIDPDSPGTFWAPDSVALAVLACCTGHVDANLFVHSSIDSVWPFSHQTFGPSSDVLDVHWCDARTLIVLGRDTHDDALFVSVLDARDARSGGAPLHYRGTLPRQSLYERIWAYNRATGRLDGW